MKILLSAGSLFISLLSSAQNVGINTTTPSERLDVNGNINVTGTIKANGVDGTANQVLMKDGSGSLAWGNLCKYSNSIMLRDGPANWIVPANVTRIFVEVWGAGGGGNALAGGCGGTYIAHTFIVSPGQVASYTCGDGGSGAGVANALGGSQSIFTVNSLTISASGGSGASYSAPAFGTGGFPGGYSYTSSITGFFIAYGKPGEPRSRNYVQFNATTYYEMGQGGRGGPAGNSSIPGSIGGGYIYNTTAGSLISSVARDGGSILTAGGGAGGYTYGASTVNGDYGGDGIIVIHY